MPKQTGTLKALNASLKILYNNRKKEYVSNDKFKELIIEELNFPKDKQDPAKLVKQSEMARYFGLSGFYKKNFDRKQKILPAGIKFYETKSNNEKISIIFDQLKKISFGKNTAAVKDSKSIIDPPKLYLKAIYELNYIEKNEFSLLLYRTANEKKTFKEGIIEIIKCREKKTKVPTVPIKYINKYSDFKFNVFFEELKILKLINKKYYLTFYINENYLESISNLSIYNDTKNLESKYLDEEENNNEKINYHLANENVLEQLNNRKPKLQSLSKINYVTNRRIRETVFKKNNYNCFFDKTHKTFLRFDGTQFMEGHHIIPMKAQKDFKNVNIDREENILCICPNCHRKIHQSIDTEKKEILKKVYEYKKKELFKANLKISFHDLFNKYYSNNVEIDLESLQNQTQIKKALLIEKFVKKNIKDYKTGASEDEATTLTNLLIKEYIEKK